MSTLIIHHDDCLKHDPGRGHPEQVRRLAAVMGGLEGLRGLEYLPAPLVTAEHPEAEQLCPVLRDFFLAREREEFRDDIVRDTQVGEVFESRFDLFYWPDPELQPLVGFINATLARTVMTSLTMILALLALLIWGPQVIFGFTAAMLFGVVIGTYSSVYMAAPVLIWLKVGPDTFVPAAPANDKAEKVGGPESIG